MSREQQNLEWVVRDVRYAISEYQLEIWHQEVCLARMNLVPRSAEAVRVGTFRREGNRIWAGLEGGIEGRAVLELKDGRITYTVETNVEHFDSLTYFPESGLCGDLWHSFVWSQRDRAWDVNEDVSVHVGECGDALRESDGDVIDPGDSPPYWPGRGLPRVVAAHHPDFGWWGICMPGPIPVCETHFSMQRRKFEILFEYLSPGCDGGFMPTVVFDLHPRDPNDPYSIMRTMWDLSEPWRLVSGRDYEQTKFIGMPVCHPWEAMQHAAGHGWAAPIPPAEKGSPFNLDFLLGLLGELVELEPSLKWHFLLPQGWYKCIGDFSIGDNFGGEEGFRRLANEFRKGGHLLTIHQRFNHFNSRSQVWREHSDWIARVKTGRPKPMYWSPNEKFDGPTEIMDVTREEVRGHIKRQMWRFLSDVPGCLDMDGISMTGDNWPNSLDYELHDEKYGVGDLLAYKLNKEIFLYGKSIKPHAWLAGTTNRLYGVSSMVGTTEDHLPIPIHSISQLRLISNLCPTLELALVSYCMTRTKSLTFWPLQVAVGVPRVDNPRAFSSPTLTSDWIPIAERYKRRLRSALAAYANSPVTEDNLNVPAMVEQMGLRYEVFAARLRTKGPLAGFYGAFSIGSRTVVTYSETRAVVSSTESRTVTFPLPPGKQVKAVERMTHDGALVPHEYSVSSSGKCQEVTLHIEDCGSETKFVQVKY